MRWKAWIAAVASVGLLASCQGQDGFDWPTIQQVSVFADWAGIAGFLLGIKIWWTTRTLSQRFLRIARIPELLKDLAGLNKRLLTAVQTDSLTDVGAIASQLDSSLGNVSSKVDWRQKIEVWKLRRKLKKMRSGDPVGKEQARHIWDELQGIIKTLEHIKSENRWGN
nr:hypothetical protein [Stenotrophomonas geniculata]